MTQRSSEAAYSFSMKNQMDQRQPLLTVRGDSALEFADNLEELGLDSAAILAGFGSTGVVGATEQAVGNIESGGLVPQVQPAAMQPPQQYRQQPVQSAPQQQAAPAQQAPWGAGASAATPQAPTCHHGVRTHRTGEGSRGEWAAWFCPSPKGTPDQCDPIWSRDAAYVAPQ